MRSRSATASCLAVSAAIYQHHNKRTLSRRPQAAGAYCTVKPRLQLGHIVHAAWPAAGPAPTPAAPPPLPPPPPPPSATVLVRDTINARIDGVGKYQSCMVFCCVVFYLVAIPALGCPSGRAPPPALGRRWQWRARVAAAPANPAPPTDHRGVSSYRRQYDCDTRDTRADKRVAT